MSQLVLPKLQAVSRLLAAMFRAVARRRGFWPDALGILIAVLYAWPTTAYRFGRDQALFHYIGREWLNGTVPYRDAFDLKPPAIYMVHAISIALLGARQSAIRIFDILAVVATGVVAALSVRRCSARAPGEIAVAVLLVTSWYFTVFDYWDSAQVEIWEGLCLLAAYALLMNPPAIFRRRNVLFAGAFVGLAGLFKFTAAIPALGIGILVVARAWATAPKPPLARARAVAESLFAFGLGASLLVGAAALYFASTGGIAAVGEMIEYVMHYARDGTQGLPASDMLDTFWLRRSGWWLALFAGVCTLSLVRAARRRDVSALYGQLTAVALLALCVASVFVQRKFFSYHWGVVSGFFVVLPLYAVAELRDWSPGLKLVPALSVMLGGFLSAPAWDANSRMDYRRYVLEIWRRRSELSDSEFNRTFVGISAYNYDAQDRIARTIRGRAKPGDLLHVRGFELAIYALTGLRTPARFVSEVHFDHRAWGTHHEEWSAQQEQVIWSARPRFIVTFKDRPRDLKAIESHGYRSIDRAGLFVLFERQGS